MLIVMFIPFLSYADCTATVGSTVTTHYQFDGLGASITVPITVTCDSSVTAITDEVLAIPAGIRGYELRAVEIDHGLSTASILIENSVSTPQWSLSAMDATANKQYGGHIGIGIYPVFDDTWQLTLGTLTADDTFAIKLKFRLGD
jgi:hypothetical protein